MNREQILNISEKLLLQNNVKIEFYIPNKQYKNFEKIVAFDKEGKEIQILKKITQYKK